MNTDEYEKARRRGGQIQWVRAYYGQQQLRHLYDLGILNTKRLNMIFHAHSEDYWRGHEDRLLTLSGADPATPPTR